MRLISYFQVRYMNYKDWEMVSVFLLSVSFEDFIP